MNRTIAPAHLKPLVEEGSVTLLDVRRRNDYDADPVTLPGAEWKNPEQIADWCSNLSRDREVIIYCARGGSVSNSILDGLRAKGFKTRFIEGGIEGWKAAGGATVPK